jgi:uncharacterized protein YbjT (DUF2867 family)
MQRILVTGGNIGNYVATSLAEKGFLVRVLVRKVTKNTVWDRLGIEQIAGDFNDLGSLRPAFESVEKFFSLSPLAENLVQLGINSIEAAKRSGVRYLVRSSAMGADENAITIGRWHREVEKALESSGLAYTILRPNAFMQNFLLSAGSIKEGSGFYQPLGDAKVSHIDLRDIAAVADTVLSEPGHEGKKYVLTGPEALSNSDIAAKFSIALNRRVQYFDVAAEQTEDSMRKTGMPEWMIRIYLELFARGKAGYASAVSVDVAKVLSRQAIRFDEFLRDHLHLLGEASAGAAAT